MMWGLKRTLQRARTAARHPDILLRDYYRKKYSGLFPELLQYDPGTMSYVKEVAAKKGLSGLGAYYRLLRRDASERSWFRTNLTYSGTHFFRGEDWDFFASRCLSGFAGRERLRAWCAGCSSGEEVYSLLMALADYVPPEKVDVLATDYNEAMLEKCRKAEYFPMHLPEIPERYRRFVEDGPKKFRIRQELVDVVRTEPLNLLMDEFPAGFDVILCRNVLKFFSDDVIARLQKRLAVSLAPGGVLFLSEDDGYRSRERIGDPAALGLEQLDDRCIYRRR